MRFQDKSVIITGGGGKIGKAYAMGFAKEGAKVALPDIASADHVVKAIRDMGGAAISMACDVADEWYEIDTAAAFEVLTCAREVHEDAAHQPRRHGEEVDAVLPVDLLRANQAEIRLVDERGRLQAVANPLARHAAFGDAVQLAMNERDQLLERSVITATPVHEQAGDVRSQGLPPASFAIQMCPLDS